MRLKDKVALVTGGAQGFGAGIAKTFHREGAKIIVVDISFDNARDMAAKLGRDAIACAADVSSLADTAASVKAAIDAFGRLDIVVNNAGISHRNKPLLEVDEAEFDRVYAVNVKSIYAYAQAAIPQFRKQGGGVFLNIGSTAGIRPRPGLTWYNGTKGAVNLLTRSMAVELAPDKIRVNALAPVAGETPLLPTFMGQDTPEKRAQFIASIPLGRLSTPQDIANAGLYLCSDEANFITGVVLEVDGGRTI